VAIFRQIKTEHWHGHTYNIHLKDSAGQMIPSVHIEGEDNAFEWVNETP
jgi:hypothetical protein